MLYPLFRGKTISLEKIRLRLSHDVDTYEAEDKCLAEYRRELELLQQEKMAHVEELRQIHSDINAVSKKLGKSALGWISLPPCDR